MYLIRYLFDCIDGYYARKYNMTTIFGDWYDHISELIISLIYIILLYIKNKYLFKYFIIFLIILFFLLLLHVYYQEKYYNKNVEAPALNMSNNIIPNFFKPKNKEDLGNKLLVTRWFGCGTGILYQIIWLLIYDYYMNRK